MRQQTAVDLRSVQTILVINLGGIGDLILSSPAVKALRSYFPSATIDLLAVDRCTELMAAYGMFTTLHPFDTRSFFSGLRQARHLSARRYDLALNMRTMVGLPGAVRILLLMALIHPRMSAGRNTDGYGRFFDISIPETLAGNQPEGAYDIDMLAALGIPVHDRQPYLPVAAEHRAAVEQLLALHGIQPSDRVLAVHPGGVPSHRWPAENFALLLRRIAAALPVKIVLTGSAAEEHLCSAIKKNSEVPAIAVLAGKTSVLQAAALFARTNLVISNDTGTVHMCTALGTAGVFLFGGGNRVRYAALPPGGRHRMLSTDTACSPCEKRQCATPRCLTSLSVDEVFAAVSDLYATIHD